MGVLPRQVVAVTGAAALTFGLGACGGSDSGSGGTIELSIAANAITGGKNAEEAEWIEDWVIPQFEEQQRSEGVDVDVSFQPSGVDDEQFKTKLALDLQSGAAPDVINLDGIWVGEFAQAGYIEPLEETSPETTDWDGWEQIPDAVQDLASFDGDLYGIPAGTDARVLFYNKTLFEEAGLPAEWQPTNWAEIVEAGEALGELDGVTPIQLNAGTAMGEATTSQGILPLLAGAGEDIHDGDHWTGASAAMEATLGLYEDIYSNGLGDPLLQEEAQGREKSFERFAADQVGILAEGDYFWRSVVHPEVGVNPMEDRDENVGYAMIPAIEPGEGVRGQDFVSMSGGSARVLNPSSDEREMAYALLEFMNSPAALKAAMQGDPRITARTDVNDEVLADDEMLSFMADEVLPLTSYRPALSEYPEVSVLLQEATASVVSGESAREAAESYQQGLEEVVGGDHVTS